MRKRTKIFTRGRIKRDERQKTGEEKDVNTFFHKLVANGFGFTG